jgi:hypothetical protein
MGSREEDIKTIGIIKDVVKEVAKEVVGLTNIVIDNTHLAAKKAKKRYSRYIIASIILFLVLLFYIYSWYSFIFSWITYGVKPNEDTYLSGIMTSCMLGVTTVVFILVIIVYVQLLK